MRRRDFLKGALAIAAIAPATRVRDPFAFALVESRHPYARHRGEWLAAGCWYGPGCIVVGPDGRYYRNASADWLRADQLPDWTPLTDDDARTLTRMTL